MAERIQIRRGKIEDCAAIAGLLLQSFAEFRSLYTDGGFAATALDAEQAQARMKEGPVWVAVHQAVIVGSVGAVKKGETVYVRGMAVLPSVRGSGTRRSVAGSPISLKNLSIPPGM